MVKVIDGAQGDREGLDHGTKAHRAEDLEVDLERIDVSAVELQDRQGHDASERQGGRDAGEGPL